MKNRVKELREKEGLTQKKLGEKVNVSRQAINAIVSKYAYWLSDSRWSLFIQNKNMKFIGLGMIGIAIIIDIFSALRRKKYDEYQIIALEKIMLFNGLFITIIFPFSLFILIFAPIYFVETIFAFILFQWLCMVITEVLYLFKNYKI